MAFLLVLAWAALAVSFAGSAVRGTFNRYYGDPVASFAIGTWVAGTSVTCIDIASTIPVPHLLISVAASVAIAVWLWYLWLVRRGFGTLLRDATQHRAIGVILLSTVSTQSLVVVAAVLWPGPIVSRLLPAMIAVGAAFYLLGFVIIVQRYRRQKGWRLADDWHNTNCILHGALSITGLAAVTSASVPLIPIEALWGVTVLLLLIVEGIEVVRARDRVKAYGWARGIGVYDPSQWARTFTIGMFYAFTLNLHAAAPASRVLAPILAIQRFIATVGPYVVLALIVAECAVFVGQPSTRRAPAEPHL